MTGVSPTEKLVLIALADYAQDKGGGLDCWPSVGTIASITGFSERAVKGATAKLVTKGLLQKTARHRQNGSDSSRLYTLNITLGAGGAPEAGEGQEVPLLGAGGAPEAGEGQEVPLLGAGGAPEHQQEGHVLHPPQIQVGARAAPPEPIREPINISLNKKIDTTLPKRSNRRSPPLKAGSSSERPKTPLPLKAASPIEDPEFIALMVRKFGEDLGGEEEIAAQVAQAMNHRASDKAKDKHLYVANWLRRQAGWAREGQVTRGPPGNISQGGTTEGYCQGCGALGPLPVSGRFCDYECGLRVREAKAAARANREEERHD